MKEPDVHVLKTYPELPTWIVWACSAIVVVLGVAILSYGLLWVVYPLAALAIVGLYFTELFYNQSVRLLNALTRLELIHVLLQNKIKDGTFTCKTCLSIDDPNTETPDGP